MNGGQPQQGQQMLNPVVIRAIAEGQQRRTVLGKTNSLYISKCRRMTKIIDTIDEIRLESLELDEQGKAIEHFGDAVRDLKLKLPIFKETAQFLFAAISVDESLPKKRRRLRLQQPLASPQQETLVKPFPNNNVSIRFHQNLHARYLSTKSTPRAQSQAEA